MIDFRRPTQESHLAPGISLARELGTKAVAGIVAFGAGSIIGAPTIVSAIAGVIGFAATNPN